MLVREACTHEGFKLAKRTGWPLCLEQYQLNHGLKEKCGGEVVS